MTSKDCGTSQASEIERLAFDGTEPASVARLRTDTGIELVTYNAASSALMAMSKGANPLMQEQLEAGIRFEADHLMGNMSQSNALVIMRHLQSSLPASAKDMERKVFGHLMRGSSFSAGGNVDYSTAKLTAAYRKGWIKNEMSKVSYLLVDLLIVYDLGIKDMADRLQTNRAYIGQRVREALSELAACYAAFDLMDGASRAHPTVKVRKFA